jgi:hypothetical protein
VRGELLETLYARDAKSTGDGDGDYFQYKFRCAR